MRPRLTQTDAGNTTHVPLAILLDGVPETWGANVLQVVGRPTSAQVRVDGYGVIDAPAILLSQEQARHLATQIFELLGPEARQDTLHLPAGNVAR